VIVLFTALGLPPRSLLMKFQGVNANINVFGGDCDCDWREWLMRPAIVID